MNDKLKDEMPNKTMEDPDGLPSHLSPLVKVAADCTINNRPMEFRLYRVPSALEVSLLAARAKAGIQHAKRKRPKPDAWRTEAQTARRDMLAAVAVMNEPEPIFYGEDMSRHRNHQIHKAVRLLCRSIMAWARARDLAHVAHNVAALDYCTRGLRATQQTPRPPRWCPEIEEMPT